jgi:hypothetical protein
MTKINSFIFGGWFNSHIPRFIFLNRVLAIVEETVVITPFAHNPNAPNVALVLSMGIEAIPLTIVSLLTRHNQLNVIRKTLPLIPIEILNMLLRMF